MSTALNDHRPLATRVAAWRLDPSSSAFELRVKHRLGPICVAGGFRRADGLFRFDTEGDIRIRFTIDTAGLELRDEQNDPRSRSYNLPDFASGPVVRFESTAVADNGAGRLHVIGQLAVGARCMPLELGIRAMEVDGSLDVMATALVDHRRLGLTWIPAGPLKAPTELAMRARLIPITDAARRGSVGIPRRRRPTAVNSRYSFMARRQRGVPAHGLPDSFHEARVRDVPAVSPS